MPGVMPKAQRGSFDETTVMIAERPWCAECPAPAWRRNPSGLRMDPSGEPAGWIVVCMRDESHRGLSRERAK